VYAHYAKYADLNWRDLAKSAHASTRTLRKYFGTTDELSRTLVKYHLSYLERYYSKTRFVAEMPRDIRFSVVQTFVKRNKLCYQFTDSAFNRDLVGQGKFIHDTHLNYIREAMIRGGTKKDKINPEMAFNFFLTPLPDNKKGKEFFNNMLNWFTT
jgi:AcrR family transcriptional regulator